MTAAPPIVGLLLLLGLGFFFGLAFEEFHARSNQKRPGGIRSFPLLALMGALLYRLDPTHLVLLSAGLLALSAWLTCNVLAYLLGPVVLAEPPWVAVGATVAAVLLLTARQELHGFARRIELGEIVNAGRFLLLTGFILPLLPDTSVTDLTPITPHQVWLAVVAVCTVSYASYLLQRYVAPPGAPLLVALLGGLYSSTATTLVLARRARAEPQTQQQAETGIILATAVMYLRLLLIIVVFNRPLALELTPKLLVLSALGLAMAFGWYWIGGPRQRGEGSASAPNNPLELVTAVTFAVLFVVISIASSWATQRFGSAGVYALAAIVGVSDIDPFVLNLAQPTAAQVAIDVAVGAILVATSSNNLVKVVYAIAYSGGRVRAVPVAALVLLAACGIGIAVVF
jgi:uncharacterized membrane protein (DUF4010 family)